MNRCEQWEFIIHQLQESALKEYRSTQEYQLRRVRQQHLDDIMSNDLTDDQRSSMEEILSEIISFHDREADLMYQQGMRDSVYMLKTLGVLA